MANLSQIKREKMLKFLETLKEQHSDDESLIAINQIENELTSKKYGLVWEEHEEEVDVKMRTHIPVFTEVEEKEIVGNPDSEKYNFLLEGDNLHSLKLLEKTHKGKIDVIYIDPPYNTLNEKIILTVYVELPQMTHEESSKCKNRCLEKIDKSTIHLECGKECNSDKCNFLCKWFVQKNEYLFLELSALQEYLESLPDNYFLPKIEVIVKSDEKNKLSPKQFTLLKKYVDGR